MLRLMTKDNKYKQIIEFNAITAIEYSSCYKQLFMEKPKKSNYKFHFGTCWSFRKEEYEADLKKYNEWLKNNKQK